MAGVRLPKDGTPIVMYWYKARNVPVRYDAAFQKVSAGTTSSRGYLRWCCSAFSATYQTRNCEFSYAPTLSHY